MNFRRKAFLLDKLRSGPLGAVWSLLSRWLVDIFGVNFAAWLTCLSIDRDTNSGPVVLCLYRESFVKDIEQLRARTCFSFPIVMGGLTRFQMLWFPPCMQIQTFYQNSDSPEKNIAIIKSTQYAKRIISIVGKKHKVRAVLTANFDYWQDLGFKLVCREMDLPFLVLSREHPVIPKTCERVLERYTKSSYIFYGDAIAVAGCSTKKVLSKSSTVCPDEKIFITGLPRYDAWLDVDVSKPLLKRSLVTLLSFSSGYYADNTFKDVLNVFCESARLYRDESVVFLVKTKDFKDTNCVREVLGGGVPSNLICSHDVDLFSVLPESKLVINYNSLSFIEAAMAQSILAIPAWGECHSRGPYVMYSSDIPEVYKVCNFLYSPDSMFKIINDCLDNKLEPSTFESYSEFISKYIHIDKNCTFSEAFSVFLNRFLI